jgi:hypothetical protein
MKKGILRINRTLFELETGILLYGMVCQLVMLFFEQRAYLSTGLWIGIVTALLSAWHMWFTLDKGLDLDEKGAVSYLSRQNIIRYLFMAAVLIGTAAADFGNPLTAFLGLMGLKAGAYMQPFMKKVSKLLYGEEILPEVIMEEPAIEQDTRR